MHASIHASSLCQPPNQEVLQFCVRSNRKHNYQLSVISHFLKKTIHDNENKDKEITLSLVTLSSSRTLLRRPRLLEIFQKIPLPIQQYQKKKILLILKGN